MIREHMSQLKGEEWNGRMEDDGREGQGGGRRVQEEGRGTRERREESGGTGGAEGRVQTIERSRAKSLHRCPT